MNFKPNDQSCVKMCIFQSEANWHASCSKKKKDRKDSFALGEIWKEQRENLNSFTQQPCRALTFFEPFEHQLNGFCEQYWALLLNQYLHGVLTERRHVLSTRKRESKIGSYVKKSTCTMTNWIVTEGSMLKSFHLLQRQPRQQITYPDKGL